MYVCLCKGITDTQIRDAVDQGAESLRAVRDELGIMTNCGKCGSLARDIVKSALEDGSDTASFYEVA